MKMVAMDQSDRGLIGCVETRAGDERRRGNVRQGRRLQRIRGHGGGPAEHATVIRVLAAILAAAGALLSPTRTGGFGESLGNAMTAAVPIAQKQQAMEDQRTLQAAQMDWNNALRKAQLENQERARNQADTRIANKERMDAIREQRLMEHQEAMAKLATSRNDMGKYEYREAMIPDPDDPSKKIPGYMMFDKTGREPPQPVALGVTGTKGSGNKSTSSILTDNALVQADADIKAREQNGETLTDADKARIKNQAVAKAMLSKSPFMHSLNATQAEIVNQIIGNDPSIVNDPDAVGRLTRSVKGNNVIPPAKLHDISSRANSIGDVLTTLDEMNNIFEKAKYAAGAAGKVLRPTEAIGNIIGVWGDTDLADFESKRAMVLTKLPELLSYKGTGSHSKEANAQIQKILRGGNFGDTRQNTESSISMLQNSLAKDLKGLDGEYKTSTGSRLPMFRDLENTRNAKINPAQPQDTFTPDTFASPPPAPPQTAPITNNTPQPQQTRFKEGDRVIQKGVEYIYRGGKWEENK